MRLDRYSAITFTGLTPADLAPAIAAWVIPEGASRSWRYRQGVPPSWHARTLLASDDLFGADGCSVKVRWAGDHSEYLLRFVHRDESPEIMWCTTFRLSEQNGSTLLEAAVARDAPRGIRLEPKAGAPRVVMDLVQAHEDKVRPRELVLPPLNAKSEEDVAAIVDQLLFAPERQIPVVLVARDVYGDGSAVDLDAIARRMRGIAVIASLDGVSATTAFDGLLAQRGCSEELRCFNGAVHTYGPTSDVGTDHRLWLRRSLESLPIHIRSDYVGETLARHLSLDRAPPNTLFAIEDFDRRERSAKKLSNRPPALTVTELALPDVLRLRADLEAAEHLLGEVQGQADRAEEARRAADQARQSAELEASTERMLRESLQENLEERRATAAAASLSEDLRDALRAIACRSGAVTPKQSLQVLQTLYPERVVVLQDAFDSAETEGARFRKPDEVWGLLQRLCTSYYEGLLRGGDVVAKKAFTTSEYAPTGSGPELKSAACVRDRTRRYRGENLVMWPHLRAGGKGAAEDCLRIHFLWMPDEQKIIIGHCGAHLEEV